MKDKIVITKISRNDCWYGARKDIIGKVFIPEIIEDWNDGWFAIYGEIENCKHDVRVFHKAKFKPLSKPTTKEG